MYGGELDNEQRMGAKGDPIWCWLGYIGYCAAIVGCFVANIVTGFKNIGCLLLLIVAGTIPIIGTRIAKIAISGILEIGGHISSMRKEVSEVKESTTRLAQSISSKTGDITINFPPSSLLIGQLSLRAILDQIQMAVVDMPPEERQPIEQAVSEIRRRSARREESVSEGIEKLQDEVNKLSEEIRKKKGIDELIKALRRLKEL